MLTEIHALTGTSFATRHVQSAYLSWFFTDIMAKLGDSISVKLHKDTVLRVTGGVAEPQLVWLATSATPIMADVVIFTPGHLDTLPTEEESGRRRNPAHRQRAAQITVRIR
ncbi:hypothetical protein ALI144C_21180 [Actinosynnema sp. ALI-1.44]|uniref:FAD/NAD(P)-binding protein n=1 Tax=Actinosynnema sp. ALI-1.44 TaxID=1933779 RepID=UPI00097BB8C6|nr:FAD/NAD(P)-binding protein [Actinosynnema sp. ALI-1.44]ONI81069.1 hypothetical protein ALI144C_21180 [Actinosynnema sp. ALI-1.44]